MTLPLELISSQLATGRVELSVSDICSGIASKFQPAFSRAAADCRIVVPMSEVFHNLPESARPGLAPSPAAGENHLAITTSPFQTPFAIKAEEDSSLKPPVLQLPSLRPSISIAPAPEVPHGETSGVLSHPPGSGAADARSPRVKAFASSPIALRPFPRPGSPASEPVPVPVVSAEPNPAFPVPGAASTPDADDLGESFSAARLSHEPPPRAGSAPVPVPVPLPAVQV